MIPDRSNHWEGVQLASASWSLFATGKGICVLHQDQGFSKHWEDSDQEPPHCTLYEVLSFNSWNLHVLRSPIWPWSVQPFNFFLAHQSQQSSRLQNMKIPRIKWQDLVCGKCIVPTARLSTHPAPFTGLQTVEHLFATSGFKWLLVASTAEERSERLIIQDTGWFKRRHQGENCSHTISCVHWLLHTHKWQMKWTLCVL